MLKRLLIENYALIDHLDITFPGGLVIVTGETGAGKSILLGALSLVLGGRSDVSVLKDPARNCVVEATFEQEGQERFFRRIVTPQGRSRAFIDDEPSAVETLRTEASSLVDIHSQHQQLLLSERAFQQNVLDSYAGINGAVAAHARNFQAMTEAEKALADLDAQIAAAARERDYLEFQFKQLDEASLREDLAKGEELQEIESLYLLGMVMPGYTYTRYGMKMTDYIAEGDYAVTADMMMRGTNIYGGNDRSKSLQQLISRKKDSALLKAAQESAHRILWTYTRSSMMNLIAPKDEAETAAPTAAVSNFVAWWQYAIMGLQGLFGLLTLIALLLYVKNAYFTKKKQA